MITRIGVFALCCLAAPALVAAATDALLFRLFLADGSSVVSYGEYARVGDRIIFSMVTGGDAEPRLHAATLPASAIDWARTDQYSASARYQWYAETRGEEDFLRLSNGVADVLNAVLLTTDRTRALAVAQQARATLADWPREHFGYRQQDVREILSILDEVISDLRVAAGMTSFDVTLVAMTPDVVLEPLATLPSLREQIDQVFRVASLTDQPSERVALFQTALLLLDEPGARVLPDAPSLRERARIRIREEVTTDERYGRLARQLMTAATRAAARARIGDAQRVLDRISREDVRLGRRRPEMVQALQASVEAQIEAARELRLRRDQWAIRRMLYNDYQHAVGERIDQLVKTRSVLEAIRRQDGSKPDALVTLRGRLRGGADQLGRIQPPGDLKMCHDLLVGAWRFAEQAVDGRYQAARTASVTTAREASSAAAGSLLLLSRFRQEIRELLEPPRLP